MDLDKPWNLHPNLSGWGKAETILSETTWLVKLAALKKAYIVTLKYHVQQKLADADWWIEVKIEDLWICKGNLFHYVQRFIGKILISNCWRRTAWIDLISTEGGGWLREEFHAIWRRTKTMPWIRLFGHLMASFFLHHLVLTYSLTPFDESDVPMSLLTLTSRMASTSVSNPCLNLLLLRWQ